MRTDADEHGWGAARTARARRVVEALKALGNASAKTVFYGSALLAGAGGEPPAPFGAAGRFAVLVPLFRPFLASGGSETRRKLNPSNFSRFISLILLLSWPPDGNSVCQIRLGCVYLHQCRLASCPLETTLCLTTHPDRAAIAMHPG